MADWAQTAGAKFETAGAVTASTRGTILTSGLANTKGSWVQLLDPTTVNADAIAVCAQVGSAGNDVLLDIGVGAAASEQVVLANWYLCLDNTTTPAFQALPIGGIPAGSRVAARCQASGATQQVFVEVVLMRGGFAAPAGLNRVTAYGANTADSGGVSVDPGAAANTKGSWSEITSATTNPIRHLLLRFGNQANAGRTAGRFLADLAVGAAASEQVVLANLPLAGTAQEAVLPDGIGLPLQVPAGTRLAMRAQCTITDATDRLFDVIAYGCD